MKITNSLSAIVPTHSLSDNLVSEILSRFSKTETEADIFQTAVEIIYRVLKCDRAVIYSLQADSYCQVIAEVVTPGYAQLVGQTIPDSCFESEYLDKYQKGRVKAVEDISNSDLSLCHIKNLQKIQVRANAIVPLIGEDRSLMGLLIVHQCSHPRQWQQSEISFLLQTANWTIEQRAKCQRSARLARRMAQMQQQQQLLETITRKLHQAANTDAVLQVAVQQAQEFLKCDRVVAYSLEDYNIGTIIAESAVSSLAPILGRVITDPCLAYSYKEKYQDGRVRAMNNIYKAGMSSCYIDNLAKIAVKSNIVVPINLDNGEIFGLLVAHECFQFRDWQPEEIDGLGKIASQTGLSLAKTKLQEKFLALESNLSELKRTRDRLTIAKLELRQLKNPSEATANNLAEINNLNKLLEREISIINQNETIQTKKELKLVHLFARKLVFQISNLQENVNSLSDRRQAIENIIQDLVMDFN